MAKSFSVITLGCAKNEVDSEFIIGIMIKAGYKYESNINKANIIIINTCAFLESSVNESIQTVLNISELKKDGALKTIVLTGCIIHRYKKDLFSELPEVDIFLSTEEFAKLPKILETNKKGAIYKNFDVFLGTDKNPRVITGVPYFAYVKIAEGCAHKCAYCTIPSIKGGLKSRKIPSIIKEVKELVSKGVKEINLIAQDLSAYGKDLKDGSSLNTLIDALHNENFPCMFRILYLYPTGITDSLLKRISSYEDFCNYIDLPLQHTSENVLKAMLRPVGKFSAKNVVKFIKDKYPQISIRTTFIVGFPNETSNDIDELKDFVKKGYFSSLGVFEYSFEEGSSAYTKFPNFKQNKKEVKKQVKEIEILQQKARGEQLKALKGKVIKILLEGFHKETDLILTGRAEFQAPEVDGEVLITESKLSEDKIEFGKFYNVKVKKIRGYDIEASIISEAWKINKIHVK